MKTFYIVSHQNRREPECYIGGLYDDEQLADARCKVLREEYDEILNVGLISLLLGSIAAL